MDFNLLFQADPLLLNLLVSLTADGYDLCVAPTTNP